MQVGHVIEELEGGIVRRTAKGSRAQMAIEVALLERLQLSLNTPKPSFESPHTMTYPKLPGTSISLNFPSLSSELAHALVELHNALTVEEARSIGLKEFKWPHRPEELKKRVPPLLKSQVLRELFERFIGEFEVTEPFCLVHNDLHVGNMLRQGAHLTGLIDFSEAATGEPYLDFRQLPRFSCALFKETIAIYSRLSGTELDLKKACYYYLATEFSTIASGPFAEMVERRLLNDEIVLLLSSL